MKKQNQNGHSIIQKAASMYPALLPAGCLSEWLGFVHLAKGQPDWPLGLACQIAGFLLIASSIPRLAESWPVFRKEESSQGFFKSIGEALSEAMRVAVVMPVPLRLLLGLVLGALGINRLYGPQPDWISGLPLQMASAFFLIHSFHPRAEIPSFQEAGLKRATPALPQANPSFFLLAIGFLAAGQWFFRKEWFALGTILTVETFGWLFWVQGRGWVPGKNSSPFPVREKRALWLILAFETLFTLSQIGANATGLIVDEANNLNSAVAVARGGIQSPFVTSWGGTPTLPYFLVGAAFKVFGAEIWAARLVSSLAAIATLWFFFHWCRFFFGSAASVIATYWLAVSWWQLYFALSAWHNSLLFLSAVSAFYFLEKGLRNGRRMDFWWAGIAAAACVMNYVPGRSVPVMMALTLTGYLLFRGKEFGKVYWRPLCLALSGFFWFLGPFLVYAIRFPQEVWGRVNPGWIEQEAHRTGTYWFLFKAYFWSLVTFWSPNPNALYQFNPPPFNTYLDPVVGAFCVLGLGLCLVQFKKPMAWVVIPAVFLGLSGNALGIQASPANVEFVHFNRISIALPFLFFTAGWGLDWLLKAAPPFLSRGGSVAAGLLLSILMLGPLAFNAPVFLDAGIAYRPSNWIDKGLQMLEMGGMVNAEYPKRHFLIEADLHSPNLQFLTLDKSKYRVFDRLFIPLPYQVRRDVRICIEPWRLPEDLKRQIFQVYPGAKWGECRTPWGLVYMATIDIPKGQIQESQKGMALSEELP